MCGVIGLLYSAPTPRLGAVASDLLRTLEYRGYDSTGGAFQDQGEVVDLRKDVGAPSLLVRKLGMVDLAGQVFCGQVRWATFGAVDAVNAQPHVVTCKRHLYGAHNGNVTNSDQLKAWLQGLGHLVRSDNDGEMVVHTIEHFFGEELDAAVQRHGAAAEDDPATRRAAMRQAIATASAVHLQGSFAAVVCDPRTRTVWAIKRGSSLYVGVGSDESGPFGVASSDLSSVLKRTPMLLPIVEGQFAEFRAADLGSESGNQAAGGTTVEAQIFAIERGDGHVSARPLDRRPVRSRLEAADFALAPPYRTFMEQEIAAQPDAIASIIDLFAGMDGGGSGGDVAWGDAVGRFVETCARAVRAGRSLTVVCCGSSFHAARAGAIAFDALAGVALRCVLPGEFRAELAHSLRDGDVVIAISQSGETKDLIDILNDVQAGGRDIARLALVNNVNSTLAQEKAEVVVPLRCGPEIAVPATKSFLNQVAVLHGIALRLAAALERGPARLRAAWERFGAVPALLRQTIVDTADDVEKVSASLALRPTMHLLGTRLWPVAKEGALKIREVVLNHTEGYEASEFKHGPNTILGRNTVWGPPQLERLLRHLSARLGALDVALGEVAGEQRLAAQQALVTALVDPSAVEALPPEVAAAVAAVLDADALHATLDAPHPLLYVTGPDARDVALTISQLNTHKIRGSETVVIAEEDPALRGAACKPPADNPLYQAHYLVLPPSGDALTVIYLATVVLQRLALRMSERKAEWLDARGIRHHGVHPDVPKNVSKSITVD